MDRGGKQCLEGEIMHSWKINIILYIQAVHRHHQTKASHLPSNEACLALYRARLPNCPAADSPLFGLSPQSLMKLLVDTPTTNLHSYISSEPLLSQVIQYHP